MATLEEEKAKLEAELAIYKTAETDILTGGQAFQKGGSDGFKGTMADIRTVQAKIRELQDSISLLGLAI